MKVVLAGMYPAGTYEKLCQALPKDCFDVTAVDTEEGYASMTDAEIIILRGFKAPEEIMERNPSLKMIMRWGAGFDSVDIAAAGKRGVLVTNTPGANAGAVSELAVMLMLAVGRKLLCHSQSLRAGSWSKNSYVNSSFTLNQKLVGIIGGGNIGRQVAQKAQAFGARIQYYDAFRLPEEVEREVGMVYVPLEQLVATSDIISLHVPMLDSTRHIIDADAIGRMKPGAILVNTARGGLVDERALVAAVRSGHLAGAGLDVTEEEPLPADHELLNDPNIIVTPHVGGGTADIGDAILPMLVNDIQDFCAGKPVRHVVNREYLKGRG